MRLFEPTNNVASFRVLVTLAVVMCAQQLDGSFADDAPKSSAVKPNGSTRLKLRPVPNLDGKRLSVAKQLLRLREFNSASGVFYIASDHWRDDIKPDTVYMQTPQPNSLVPEGTTVAFWVFLKATDNQSLGITPDLRGLTCKMALLKLEGRALLPSSNPKRARRPGLIVTDHYPKAGKTAFKGTSVFLKFGSSETDSK